MSVLRFIQFYPSFYLVGNFIDGRGLAAHDPYPVRIQEEPCRTRIGGIHITHRKMKTQILGQPNPETNGKK